MSYCGAVLPRRPANRGGRRSIQDRTHSAYEISEALRDLYLPLSPTAVREVLKAEGFSPLPRRLDAERPDRLRLTIEPTAGVRSFSVSSRLYDQCGVLFPFVSELIRLSLLDLACAVALLNSKMIPHEQDLLATSALQLISIDRNSHIMSQVTTRPGLLSRS